MGYIYKQTWKIIWLEDFLRESKKKKLKSWGIPELEFTLSEILQYSYHVPENRASNLKKFNNFIIVCFKQCPEMD